MVQPTRAARCAVEPMTAFIFRGRCAQVKAASGADIFNEAFKEEEDKIKEEQGRRGAFPPSALARHPRPRPHQPPRHGPRDVSAAAFFFSLWQGQAGRQSGQ